MLNNYFCVKHPQKVSNNEQTLCWQAITLPGTLLQTFPWDFFKMSKTILTTVSDTFPHTSIAKIKLSRNCKNASLCNLQNGSQ